MPAGASLTTGEVATLSGLPEVAALAVLVDHAAYAPEDPAAVLPARAWATADEARRRVRAGMRIRARIRAFLDPRTLRRRPAQSVADDAG